MAATKAQIGALYVGYFNRGADPEGLNYWLGQTQLSLVEIANSFAVQPEAKATYAWLAAPNINSIPAITQFITEVYQNVFERDPDAVGLAYWVDQIVNQGKLPGRVVVDIESGAVGDDKLVLDHKTEVSVYYAEKFALSGDVPWNAADDLAGAHAALDGSRLFWISNGSVATGKAHADEIVAASFASTFDLTTGTDTFVGTSADDIFNAPAMGTAFLPLSTLNTTDSLDGAGGRNTLNAQLVEDFVVPHLLMNIQVLNIDSPSSVFVPHSPNLDVIHANAIDTINFRNPTQDIELLNLQTALQAISIQDDSDDGNTFDINHIGPALDGPDDGVFLTLSNDGAGSTLNLNGEGGDYAGYERVGIFSLGPVMNVLELNASPRDILVTGVASLEIRGDALSLDTMQNFDSTGLAGPAYVDAEFFDGLPGSVVNVDTGEGDDSLSFLYGTRGFVTVNSNGGDDYVWFGSHTGHVVVNSGAGDDSVYLTNTGNAEVNGGDGDDYMYFDVVGSVHAQGGTGDDEFFFAAQGNPVGLPSFGTNDFADGGDGDDLLDIEARSANAGDVQLLLHGAGITNIETIRHFGAFTGGASDLLVNMAQAGSAELLILAGTYSDDVRVTALTNDQTIEVQSDIADDLVLTHQPAALEVFNLVLNGGVSVGELITTGFDPDVVNIESIGGGLNAIHAIEDVFGDLLITGDTNLQLGDDYASGYAFSAFPPGGFVDASAFTGDLTFWAQFTVQTIIGGSGDDWFNAGGGDDQFDLSHGGSDTVVFENYSDNGNTSLGSGLLFQNITTGYSVADDHIVLDISRLNLEGTDNSAATPPIVQLDVVQNGSYVTGLPAVNFLLFTTSVTGATSAQNGFNIAIGGGEIEVASSTDNVLGAFYDASHSQAVLFAVDADSSGANDKIQSGDDVDVVALVGMSYADFLNLGSSLTLVA